MEVIQKLDLKSSEEKEYNSEDKGLSENSTTVYLSKNITDTGLDAPLLLEPPQNYEGSETDQVDSFGCCLCFSFINFFKRPEEQVEIPYQHVCVGMERKAGVTKKKKSSKRSKMVNDIVEEDDFMNEFKRPVKQAN
ncbi:Uncharacterized protein Fot_02291 [Forsythia ovata]|uniref:Uncharacterized protein n=1 Tax=Forsythia ovata TaxID=205694 RepID=A0ABD1X6X9_9LAMI